MKNTQNTPQRQALVDQLNRAKDKREALAAQFMAAERDLKDASLALAAHDGAL